MTQSENLFAESITRVKVKVCGMTQASQVRDLVKLGVDAIGVILHANSPRLATVTQAKMIRDEIPAFITMVGVVVDCDATQVNRYVSQIGLDLVQLHGAETSDYTQALNCPYIKAIRAKSADQVKQDMLAFSKARALLLDPYVKGQHGGTGQRLDASLWPNDQIRGSVGHKLILAGGLSKENILQSVQRYQPYAVDLNSGVECAPGIKDIDLVSACLAELGR